jgi:hypothetical protein
MRKMLLAVLVASAMLFGNSVHGKQTDEASPPQRTPNEVTNADKEAGVPVGHLEVPRDPYIPMAREARRTSPAMQPTRNGYVSVQVNVDANGENIIGDAANEPSIAVDPTEGSRMAIGWRQFDTIISDFRQAGWGYSNDGGNTWTFPGVIEPGVFRSDPVLCANTQGTFFYNSLTASAGLTEFWCDVYKSFDGGATWDMGVNAWGGDKQWMVCDLTDGIGQDNLYAFWTLNFTCPECDGHFTRSYDGGETFRATILVDGNPYWGTLSVGPSSELYISGNGFTVTKSTDVKFPDIAPTWDFTTTVSLDGSMVASAGPNPGGLLGQVWIATDHTDGATHGNVYLLCSVNRSSSADPCDVMFARSTDGGVTWSAPIRVNDDPVDNGAWQWFGTMSVAPNGRIDVVWNDTRNDPGGYMSEVYYAYSNDAGDTWSPNVALTPAYDPHVGWPQQNKMGDYFDMVSDDDGADLAFAATFNGEQDVYYMRVTRGISISFPNGVPEILTPGQPTEITVRIDPASENYVPGSATLYYRYGTGEFLTAPLQELGGDLFLATLLPAFCADEPTFYFSAEGDATGVVFQPPLAPSSTFSAAVGEYNVIFAEDFELDHGWTAVNLGATSGDWQRGVPVNDPNWEYDPISDSDGSGQCFLTQNELGNTDVDDGAVRLISPTIDMSGSGDITIGYDYFLRLTDTAGGVDRILVEIDSNDGSGPWTEIARHDTDGGLTWRHHDITQADLDAAGVTLTSTMRIRFDTNDADPQSINESAIDAFEVSGVTCPVQHYCETVFHRPLCMGDGNGDGQVTPADIGGIKFFYGSTEQDELCYYDVNCDGSINPMDVGLAKFYYGACDAESPLPCWAAQ